MATHLPAFHLQTFRDRVVIFFAQPVFRTERGHVLRRRRDKGKCDFFSRHAATIAGTHTFLFFFRRPGLGFHHRQVRGHYRVGRHPADIHRDRLHDDATDRPQAAFVHIE